MALDYGIRRRRPNDLADRLASLELQEFKNKVSTFRRIALDVTIAKIADLTAGTIDIIGTGEVGNDRIIIDADEDSASIKSDNFAEDSDSFVTAGFILRSTGGAEMADLSIKELKLDIPDGYILVGEGKGNVVEYKRLVSTDTEQGLVDPTNVIFPVSAPTLGSSGDFAVVLYNQDLPDRPTRNTGETYTFGDLPENDDTQNRYKVRDYYIQGNEIYFALDGVNPTSKAYITTHDLNNGGDPTSVLDISSVKTGSNGFLFGLVRVGDFFLVGVVGRLSGTTRLDISVTRLPIDSNTITDTIVLPDGLDHPVGLAYDAVNNQLYVADGIDQTWHVYTLNMDGSSQTYFSMGDLPSGSNVSDLTWVNGLFASGINSNFIYFYSFTGELLGNWSSVSPGIDIIAYDRTNKHLHVADVPGNRSSVITYYYFINIGDFDVLPGQGNVYKSNGVIWELQSDGLPTISS